VSQVLLIEDDAKIRTMLVRALSERGHAMSSAHTAMSGLRQAVEERPDVVILDLGLPDLDGREVLRMLRAVSRVPVIVATARDDEDEIVRVLDAGADDYVTKPFGAAQLDARIRAVLRRSGDEEEPDQPIEVGELRVDPRAREATLGGVPLELSPREFDLLHYLALRPGEVVSKRDLLTDVWRVPYGGADKTVDVHLAWLRRKLGETAQQPRYVHTVRGVGVKLVEPGRSTSASPGRTPDQSRGQVPDQAPGRTPDRAPDDQLSDRAPDQLSDRAPDQVSDRPFDR
jgi:two-component system, OmpR family, KDP operon response regulator KdpE